MSPNPESPDALAPIALAPVEHPSPLAVVAAAQRVVGFDLARAAAALAVIWVHIGRTAEWREANLSAAGSWGTAYLNMLAGFFVVWSLKKKGASGAPRFALHRIWRLYGSFLIWCAIYVLARVGNLLLFHKRSVLFGEDAGLGTGGAGFSVDWAQIGTLAFFGTTYHLWFLPYLLVITLLTLPIVALALRSRENTLFGAAALAIAALALLILPEPWWVNSGDLRLAPLSHLYMRAPGFLSGLAFGLWTVAGFRPQVRMIHALACIAIIVGAMYLSLTTELPRHILNRIAATAAFIAALAPWEGPIVRWIARFGQLGFGVYLAHVLFVEGFYSCAWRLHMAPNLGLDLMVFAASAAGSFLLAYLLRRVRWLAWTIP